jgi:hypothetical protein
MKRSEGYDDWKGQEKYEQTANSYYLGAKQSKVRDAESRIKNGNDDEAEEVDQSCADNQHM